MDLFIYVSVNMLKVLVDKAIGYHSHSIDVASDWRSDGLSSSSLSILFVNVDGYVHNLDQTVILLAICNSSIMHQRHVAEGMQTN